MKGRLFMIAPGAKPTTGVVKDNEVVVQEAMKVINEHRLSTTAVRRWVCEVCGMVHTGATPHVCESCGVSTALVQQADVCRELGSHW